MEAVDTSTPTVTLDDPSTSNGETATAFATLEGESLLLLLL